MGLVDDDEEEDAVPQSASNYYFEDYDQTPVSFALLPIQWNGKDQVDGTASGFYLRGTSDIGHSPLHKLVKAWRFNLYNFKPEISVLIKENIWIKLEKPRNSYMELIGTVLITLHSLHFLRRNPQASDKSLWDHLSKIFRPYDLKPSQNDLVDHIDLIAEAVKVDENNLGKSEFILAFLANKPTKRRLPDEDDPKDNFIVGDDTTVPSDEDELDDDEDDFSESVCAICDNGGEVLCCEGSCLRSFHPTKKDGEDSFCVSLGLTKMQVEAIKKYVCPNCEQKMHQCFICNNLGSSDKSAETAEVFQCVSATCGYFYHPRCVTKQLGLGNEAEAKTLERQIIAGEFTCPLHKCIVCESLEVKTDSKLQFAVCRRCPKSYHRNCLPREISFNDIKEEGIITRAWDGILHNRLLIFCQEHEIVEKLQTPIRDHIKFPFTEEKKEGKRKILESHVGRDKARSKVKNLGLQGTCGFPCSKDGKKHGLVSSVPENLRKRNKFDISKRVPPKSHKKMEIKESSEAGKNKLGLKEAEAGKRKGSLGGTLSNNIMKRGRVVPIDSKQVKTNSIASDKIKAHEDVACVHQSKTKDFSGRKRGKLLDSNNDMRTRDRRGLDKEAESIKIKIPKMTSDLQRSSSDAVCSSMKPQRTHEPAEASLPVKTRREKKLGNDSNMQGSGKPQEVRNRPSAVRSVTDTAQKPSYGVSFSHLNDDLAARYALGRGYRMPDQFPSTVNGPNELFDYPDLNRGVNPRQYSGHLLAHIPPNLMDNAVPMQQRYGPHFDEMKNCQRPPMQPSGHNVYDPHGQPPSPGDFGMGFASGPNYPYMGRSGGWLDD